MRYLYIAVGGGLGALARWWLGDGLAPAAAFPVGILVVNLIGCLLIGLLFPYTLDVDLNPDLRLGVITGFIGAFTTFSTWMDGTYGLLAHGETITALAYLTASLLGGLLCTLAGMGLAGALAASRR